MLPKACSIVFCQLTSSPKDSASVAGALSTGSSNPISSASIRRWQSPNRCRNDRQKIRRSCLSRLISPVDSPCCGKRVWRHYPLLSYPRHNLEPRTLERPLARTHLTDFSYKALISVTIFSGTPALFNNSQSAGQLMESKAAWRST